MYPSRICLRWLLSVESPIGFVMIQGQAVGAAVFAKDSHDVRQADSQTSPDKPDSAGMYRATDSFRWNKVHIHKEYF